MNDESAQFHISDVETQLLEKSEIPHIPAIISRIIKMASDEEVSAGKLAAEIQNEPALVIKILKIVNSSYYGMRHRVGTLTSAIAILGTAALQNIALSASIFDHLFEKSTENFFDMDKFWRHSFFSAIACQLMASKKSYLVPEEAFIVGLLHDVGILAMVKAEPEKYKKVIDTEKRNIGSNNSKTKIEEVVFASNHARLGYLFARQGEMPDFIQLPIFFHHSPAKCKNESKHIRAMTGIIYLSNIMEEVFYSENKADKILKFKTMARKWGGFNEKQSENILYEISEEIKKSKDIFEEISLDSQKTYAEILQEANTELGKINIKFDRMNRELKAREAEISRINKELRAEKDRLSEELILAKKIHLSMVPEPVNNQYLEMDIHYEPMLGVGGDSAAVYKECEERIYFSMADVTGHGVAAALISTRLEAEIASLLTKKLTPLEIIERLSIFLTGKFPDSDHYLTFFCGIFDFQEKKLFFAGAAHPPAILLRESKMLSLKSQNTLIGLDSMMRKKKGMGEISIMQGDRLVVYTDGITEKKDVNKKELGINGLVAILKKNEEHPVNGFSKLLIEESDKIGIKTAESRAGEDDRMVMAFEIK